MKLSLRAAILVTSPSPECRTEDLLPSRRLGTMTCLDWRFPRVRTRWLSSLSSPPPPLAPSSLFIAQPWSLYLKDTERAQEPLYCLNPCYVPSPAAEFCSSLAFHTWGPAPRSKCPMWGVGGAETAETKIRIIIPWTHPGKCYTPPSDYQPLDFLRGKKNHKR